MDQPEKPGHYCGVAGIRSDKECNIPEKLFYPLYSLQHRGQEAAGISYQNGNKITTYKDLGLVSKVLSHYLQESHPSKTGIGHIRYSTSGGNRVENIQPFHVSCNKGEIALAHNGNISNIASLKNLLEAEGAIFQSTSDTEIVLHLLSRSRRLNFLDALTEVLRQLQGAFSMVMVHENRLLAWRDAKGFRPLYLGEGDGFKMVASETCALDIMGVTSYREVEPGELVVISDTGVESHRWAESGKKAHCIFEFIYFARPDSEIFGRSVYGVRKRLGRELAQADKVQADLVMAVPDSGNAAALGYSEAKGIPFEMGMTRNHFAGRSFTLPSQAQREFAVKMKLHPIKEVVEGKRIVLVDDSLVRGTTSRFIVKMLREAGAKEIHLRLSSPEIHYPCFFGIDIPTRKELISNTKDAQQLAAYLGADSVMFLPVGNLEKAIGDPQNFCFGCFTGQYPEPLGPELQKELVL